MSVIDANDLKRTYRTSTGTFRRRSLEVEAVRGITFSVGEGELLGLLGPNGAIEASFESRRRATLETA